MTGDSVCGATSAACVRQHAESRVSVMARRLLWNVCVAYSICYPTPFKREVYPNVGFLQKKSKKMHVRGGKGERAAAGRFARERNCGLYLGEIMVK